jgi:beta-carotene 3-hydroxylase
MSSLAIWLPVALLVAVAMDVWAALLHGRVWHVWLWPVHASHHRRRVGAFELNDALSVLHAPIAVALVLYGCRSAPGPLREVVFGVGLGMSLFGVAYVLVHDGLIHRRLPVRFLRHIPGMRALVRAHIVHHAGVAGGAPYGLFFGPFELARANRRKRDSLERARQPTQARQDAAQ